MIFCRVEYESRCTTNFIACRTDTLAKALGAFALRIKTITMITVDVIARGRSLGSGVIFIAIFSVFITVRSVPTFYSVWPITCHIRWTIQ